MRPTSFASSSLTSFAFAIASIVFAATALAADPPKPATTKAASKANSDPIMTRDELRECMTMQDHVRELTEAAKKEQTALQADKAEITHREDALKEEMASLDRTSADAVNAFNEKVQARDKLVDAYATRSAAFNTSVDTLEAQRDAHSQKCDNRRFDEKDEIAIKKGK